MNWVSNPPQALSSWLKGLETALCWFVSILMMALLKVESRSLVVMMVLLQRAASNNDTPSLSPLSGVPLHNTMMAKVTVVTLHQEMWKIVQQRTV